MAEMINLDRLVTACNDDSFDDGIRIDTELVSLGGPGAPVKPAVYEGGRYQEDKRWDSSEDSKPKDVVVIDNTPSQANRLEKALCANREHIGIPEFILDLSDIPNLPSHVPKSLSSLKFPHRNADAYLRDAQLGGVDFIKTDLGKSIFAATAQECGPLMAWFPQALLYGFWQSHLGKKKHSSKHARSWASEIIGWQPATTKTRVLGLKGDPLNLNVDDTISFSPNDQATWEFGKKKIEGGKQKKLSEIGHGQVPFMREADASAAAISFARVTQRATLSFAQLRRVRLGWGKEYAKKNTDARVLLVALGLYAHQLAFNRGFALRSGAELRPKTIKVTWLGSGGDEVIQIGDAKESLNLLLSAKEDAKSGGIPLDGWDQPPTILKPRKNLRHAICSTWPDSSD